MVRRRTFGRIAAAGLVLLWALPAAADGLSRFETAIRDAPPGTLTYKSARPLSDNGFVVEDIILSVPTDKAPDAPRVPVAVKRLTVADFDFASTDRKLPPNFVNLRAEGISVPVQQAEGIDFPKLTGLARVIADFRLDYRLDPERKTLSVNRLAFELEGLARVEFSMTLDGVTPDAASNPDAALNEASLRSAIFTFDDHSLVAKVLPAAASVKGTDADALVGVGKLFLGGLRQGQGPAALAVLDAFESYLDDYRNPSGPLRITLDPPAKTSAGALAAIKTPDDAVKALGLVVSYPGTRPHTAGAAYPSCTPGARFFIMHEEAWRPVTVLEPTRSGEKCVARIDGGSDDVSFAPSEARAWSIDGPGESVGACTRGDNIVALYKDGGWYPAKVTGIAEAARCPIEYDSDASTDRVELKKMRRVD